MRLMLRLAVVALLVCVLAPLALADAASTSAASGIAMWTPLIAVACGAVAYFLRSWTPSDGWLHTGAGHALLVLVAGVLAAIGQAAAAQGLSMATVVAAASGAIGGFIGAGNPSNQGGAGIPPRSSGQSGRASLVVLLVLAALGFGGALAMAGCATPGGVALKNCELGALPAEEQAVLAEVGVVLMNPSAVLSDLIALAAKLGPAQVGCAVAAWDAFLASRQAAPKGSQLMMATSDEQRAHAHALTKAYLAGHPVACGGHYVAALGGANSL